MSRVLGSWYGGATTEDAEGLIAQLNSQGKLTSPRHENLKIRHEIEILKANEHVTHVYMRTDLSNDTKKNIPLNLVRLSL
jgi:hypothetical protein